MWPGILWFALLAAAMLFYPRRPRMSGILWIMLGALSFALNVQRNAMWFGLLPGIFMISMGIWYLIKHRSADVRAKHVEYWTAKA
jgi:hypothetical protein